MATDDQTSDLEMAERQLNNRFKSELHNDKMTDIRLIGDDDIPVPAVRYILACTSPVFRKMLYGDFSEANKSTIAIQGVNSMVLQALVEYCCSDELNTSLWDSSEPCERVEQVVALAELGHQYEIHGIAKKVSEFLHPIITNEPSLAYVVYNFSRSEATKSIRSEALKLMREKPDVALKESVATSCGGMACLSPEKLTELMQDKEMHKDELFLFECLVEWKQSNEHKFENSTSLCEDLVSKHFDFSSVDARDFENKVANTGLVGDKQLIDTLKKKVMKTSKLLDALGAGDLIDIPNQDMVVVRGAGSTELNGVYTRGEPPDSDYLQYFVMHGAPETVLWLQANDNQWYTSVRSGSYHSYQAPRGSGADADDVPTSGWSVLRHGTDPPPSCFRMSNYPSE